MAEKEFSTDRAKVISASAAGAGESRGEELRYGGQALNTSNSDPSEADSEHPDAQDEIAIVRRATEVLGLEHVAHWMQSKIPSLGNQTPYALLQTQEGRSQVERVLLKIEHGVY